MELLNFSYNNRYFLFFDKKDIKLKLYELRVVLSYEAVMDRIVEDNYGPPEPDDDAQEYEFVLKYELCVGESHLFTYLYGRGIDVLGYFVENPGQIKIDQFARV